MSKEFKPLRFAVIGCGAHSILYQLPAMIRCPSVDLHAVVDTDCAWARKVALRFGVPEAYASFHSVFGRVDAAVVATPNATHRHIAEALLAEGIHVLCEKPIATTLEDAEVMFNLAARQGVGLMAAHCLRFSPNLELLKRIVSWGWLGRLQEIRASIGQPYDQGARRTDFRRERRLAGGGVLIDLGVHLIDLALWLNGGVPLRVDYQAHRAAGWEVETDAHVELKFSHDMRAHLSVSFTRFHENVVSVRGSEGWATASIYSSELTVFSGLARVCRRDGAQQLVANQESMYDRQIRHFCEGVSTGASFLVPRTDVEAGLRVVESCYEAVRA